MVFPCEQNCEQNESLGDFINGYININYGPKTTITSHKEHNQASITLTTLTSYPFPVSESVTCLKKPQ